MLLTGQPWLAQLAIFQRNDKFTVMLDPVGSRGITAVKPLIFQETGWLTHA
jgi:hypothetical protein